ncbi:MAG TPA: hypothetical protein VNL98_06605, partial [Gemmatimonadales bacterium]|nr:hypothetical protein [Gemmatimonadales bacterium]
MLRLDIEVFSPDETRRGEIARALSNLGFRQSDLKLSYRDTVVIDLRPAETELLASFHATARRHIRAVEKRPVRVEIVNDPAYASRLGDLFRESLVRSGGVPRPRD